MSIPTFNSPPNSAPPTIADPVGIRQASVEVKSDVLPWWQRFVWSMVVPQLLMAAVCYALFVATPIVAVIRGMLGSFFELLNGLPFLVAFLPVAFFVLVAAIVVPIIVGVTASILPWQRWYSALLGGLVPLILGLVGVAMYCGLVGLGLE